MAFNEIPKFRWRIVEANGNSALGSDTITAMTSTAELRAGMIVSHPSFPEGTTIEEILSANSIRLSNPATVGVSAVRTFYHEIVLRYPPSEDDGEMIETHERTSTSIAGVKQVSVDYHEFKRKVVLNFLTKEEVAKFKFFWTDWFGQGKFFRYYEDKNSEDFIEYEKDSGNFTPEKVTPVLYSLSLSFRRAE